jgi:hypothetical protein
MHWFIIMFPINIPIWVFGSIWHTYPNYPNSLLRFIPHIILHYNLYDVKIPLDLPYYYYYLVVVVVV